MSSTTVRSAIKTFLTTNAPTVKVSDLSGGWLDIMDHLAGDSIGPADDWIGLQFLGNDEVPVTVGAINNSGKYRESGAIYIHVVGVAKTGVRDSILSRAETLRTLFRGQRIGGITINSVTPVNFELGATIEFEAGFISGSFILDYENEINL